MRGAVALALRQQAFVTALRQYLQLLAGAGGGRGRRPRRRRHAAGAVTQAPMTGPMNIESFDDLLQAALAQDQPQQLLFVFAGAELPAGATALQRAQFEAGEGGELAPLMCLDRLATEMHSFEALAAEAERAGPPWAIVFTAALSGRGGKPPSAADTDAALQHMVEAVKAGQLDGMLPFGRAGLPVQLA